MKRGFFIALLAGVLCFDSTLLGQEPNPVKTEIGLEEAWTGQAVPMMVTLMSPGPFSGTPVFQLPEIPGILIVKQGSPLVGSETASGESMITQRHELSIYTQKTGTVEIPAFAVDYESKETFVGDPMPRTGKTSAVTFTSKRPPGTEGLPFVVTSATLTVRDSWAPADQTEFAAGDILSRTITREASDVSAMFLQPFQPEPIEGVRIYTSEPEVTDKRERGNLTAKRVDTIKYQFETGGTFTIPEIAVAWWNPKAEKVERVELEGIIVTVKAPPAVREPKTWKFWFGKVLPRFLIIMAAYWVVVVPLERRYRAWHERRNLPEAVAGRAVIRACRENRPKEAYAALTDWRHAIGLGKELPGNLQDPADQLARFLFSNETPEHRWDGTALLMAFRQELHRRKRRPERNRETGALPPLNPSVPGESS